MDKHHVQPAIEMFQIEIKWWTHYGFSVGCISAAHQSLDTVTNAHQNNDR